jgi:hypothetical protein
MLPSKLRDGLEGTSCVQLILRRALYALTIRASIHPFLRGSSALPMSCGHPFCALHSFAPGLFDQRFFEQDRAYRGRLTCGKQLLSMRIFCRPRERQLFFRPSNHRATISWLQP